MKYKQVNDIYRVVDYSRLSVEDGDKPESDSISNQRTLIHDYLQGKDEFRIVSEQVDDGYTGTNFDRPGFCEMMRIVEKGEADCIIVKDLSRFGRDYSGVLRYIERTFPQMGVRFIAINDQYDSESESCKSDYLNIRMKALINDIYPADTSRSVRSNLSAKRRSGACVAAFAVFGYLKSPEDKNRLIVDPFAGDIVRDVFRWKISGMSQSAIADKLNELGILPPLAYKKSQGFHFKTGFETNKEGSWTAVAVSRILQNEIYTGTMVQGKRTTPNHKVKKIIFKPADEWDRVENTHEPLVSKYEFEVVAHLLSRDTRCSRGKELNLLAGLVECADCHQSMVRKSPNYINHYFVCSGSLYEHNCSPHRINEEKLLEAVKKTIFLQIHMTAEIKEVYEYIEGLPLADKELVKADRRIDKLNEEYKKAIQLKAVLYEDYKDGILEKDEYLKYKEEYNEKCERLEQSVICQKNEVSKMLGNLQEQKAWMKQILQYQGSCDITRTMLVMLVKKIWVYSANEIKVVFWFQDEYDRVRNLIASVDQVYPNEVTGAFLERKSKGVS